MTTSTAENLVAQASEKDKEKIEKRRALGRGLESLLPGPRVVKPVPTATSTAVQSAPPAENAKDGAAASLGQVSSSTATSTAPQAATDSVVNLAIEVIDRNPFQTRHVEDDVKLAELADSIAASGVVQPILVRPAQEDGRYILVLGERRLHASKKAGQKTVPAMVRKLSDQQAAEMTIIENLQREDLSALEQAEAFRTLSTKFQLTQEEIGKRVGLSRVSVANYMRLLKLPREVLQLLTERKLSFSEARELLKLDDDAKIVEAAQYAVKKNLTLEQIERLVLAMSGLADPLPGMPGQEKPQPEARWIDPNVRAAQMELERLLGLRVKIRDRKGKGRIVIEYSTVDDYERVVAMLGGKS
jgi:ParB family transcriptional regulator, chromosome partitioning protein